MLLLSSIQLVIRLADHIDSVSPEVLQRLLVPGKQTIIVICDPLVHPVREPDTLSIELEAFDLVEEECLVDYEDGVLSGDAILVAIYLFWKVFELDEVLIVLVIVEEDAAFEHVVLPAHMLHLAVDH